jgi:hypothetical protein
VIARARPSSTRAALLREFREIAEMVARASEGYEFEGPIPIKVEAELHARHGYPSITVHAWMSTLDRDTLIPATLSRSWDLDFPTAACAVRDLEVLLHHEIRRLVREMWVHEMDEWFKYKGERITDAHEDD